jgi:hypothetical protein
VFVGSNCNNNALCDETGVKRGDTVGLAQLAFCETEMAETPQLLLGFVTDAKGQTLYEKVQAGKFLLGPGD